jgi:hypothetical protein
MVKTLACHARECGFKSRRSCWRVASMGTSGLESRARVTPEGSIPSLSVGRIA